MITLIWIYALLYAASLLIMIWLEDDFHKSTNNWYTPFLYGIAIIISSFALIGVIQILANLYRTIKFNYKIWMIKLIVWKIKRKYGIK